MYYDQMRTIYGESGAFEPFVKMTGKLIIATSKDANDHRLFLRSLNSLTDSHNKKGWWNTFTVAKNLCPEGTYICKIIKVCKDKKGYPIFVAKPLVAINEDIISYHEMMYIFGISTLFTEEWKETECHYNIPYFEQKIEDFGGVTTNNKIDPHVAYAIRCIQLFISGKISAKQIVSWLNQPSSEEIERLAFEEAIRKFLLIESHNFPLLAKRCSKKFGNTINGSDKNTEQVAFFKTLLSKYHAAVETEKIEPVEGKTIFHQIEAYLQFDEVRKEKNKAEKTAKKKAKKKSTN